MVPYVCVVEGVSALVNAVGLLQWPMVVQCDAKKEKWMLLRFLIWEMDRLAIHNTFTPKKSVPHKFGLTVLFVISSKLSINLGSKIRLVKDLLWF